MDRPIPLRRLVGFLADKAQRNTQQYGSRPLGVGLLVAGVDETGPHLFELQPSGMFYEYWGYSIGNRSQAARTYFEKQLDTLPECSLEDLVKHAVAALSSCLPPNQPLEKGAFSVGYVSAETPFQLLPEDDASKYIPTAPQAPSTSASLSAEGESMAVDQ